MSDTQKVTVISKVKARVGIDLPDLKLRREWAQKGAKVQIDKDVLAEAMYDPGVEYMFKTGILYIEDMQAKKDLQLEPEDAKEPVNIIVLTDAQKLRYLKIAPIADLKEILGKLSKEQKIDLAQFAVENKLTDLERTDILKAETGIDVLHATMMQRAAEEADKK